MYALGCTILPEIIAKQTVTKKSTANKEIVIKLTSSSVLPYLVYGCLEFSDILVSLPVYTTKPKTSPEATFIFAQIVCYNLSDSKPSGPSKDPAK